MSALAGLVRFDGGPADAETIARAIDCVEHRGNDWRRVWSQRSVALAYRWRRTGRAQPIDPQPLVDELSGSALVFDGRLDNRRELACELGIDDSDPSPDARFVLAAYARWGPDAITHLLGDFAFGLWDPRQRHLVLGRDPLGLRAISYVITPDFVAFATEPRQLLRLSGVDRRPNLGFFAEWLAGRMAHPTDTIFCNVERVPPAHVATLTSGGVRLTRYWDIDPRREIRFKHDRDYIERFQDLYADAVRVRLRGLDRVGVLLSGGLDSSSVVSMATRVNPCGRSVTVHAYTLAFNGFPDGDDEEAAASVARRCGVPFVCMPFLTTNAEFYVGLARLLEDTIPGPVGSGHVELVKRAAADGCRIMFDGTGGDEWFGGAHQHTADLLRSGRVIAAIRQLRADASRPDLGHGIVTLAKSSIWPIVPNRLRDTVKRMLPQRDRVPRGFNRAFAARVALVDRITAPLTDRRFASIATGTAYIAATQPYCSYAWEELVRQDATLGVDLAAPLMDRRLAEFAMALPEEQRWAGDHTKRVLRTAMEGFLPESILRRYKADPGSVQLSELRRMYAEGEFEAMELAEEGVIDRTAVDAMYHEMLGLFDDRDAHYKMLADQLWTLFLGECVWRALFGRRATPLGMSPELACEGASDRIRGRFCGKEA